MGGFYDGGSGSLFWNRSCIKTNTTNDKIENKFKKLKETLNKEKEKIIYSIENNNYKYKIFENKGYFLIISFKGNFINIFNYYIDHNLELKNKFLRFHKKSDFFINEKFEFSLNKGKSFFELYLDNKDINLGKEIIQLIDSNNKF